MNEQVRRYSECFWFDSSRFTEVEDDSGAYVLHDDYATLQAECERLSKEQGEGTTSNRYRAELYDEVWQQARSMGYENVTTALGELAAIKAQEPVGFFVETEGEWEQVNAQFKNDSDVVALYAIPTINQQLTVKQDSDE